MGKAKVETRSPIKDLPVRQAGQSLREHAIDTILDQKVLPYLIAVMLVEAAIVSWLIILTPKPLVPATIWTVAALIACLYGVLKCRRADPYISNLRLGRIGEEAVGQFLEETLRPCGATILHDVPGDGFNLDHVVIGPTGVYCIETKTHSKRKRGCGEVTYDGARVTVAGMKPERDPIIQVKAAANFLRELLEKSTRQQFKVQPVVLYPGWYVKSSVQWPEVWVLNEKALGKIVPSQKVSLSDADIGLITTHLKLYIIAKTAELKAAKQ